jgi:hypothetical protein
VLIEDVTNGRERWPISVVNYVDDDGPPQFTYVTCYVDHIGQPVALPPPPQGSGCSCTDQCRYRSFLTQSIATQPCRVRYPTMAIAVALALLLSACAGLRLKPLPPEAVGVVAAGHAVWRAHQTRGARASCERR